MPRGLKKAFETLYKEGIQLEIFSRADSLNLGKLRTIGMGGASYNDHVGLK